MFTFEVKCEVPKLEFRDMGRAAPESCCKTLCNCYTPNTQAPSCERLRVQYAPPWLYQSLLPGPIPGMPPGSHYSPRPWPLQPWLPRPLPLPGPRSLSRSPRPLPHSPRPVFTLPWPLPLLDPPAPIPWSSARCPDPSAPAAAAPFRLPAVGRPVFGPAPGPAAAPWPCHIEALALSPPRANVRPGGSVGAAIVRPGAARGAGSRARLGMGILLATAGGLSWSAQNYRTLKGGRAIKDHSDAGDIIEVRTSTYGGGGAISKSRTLVLFAESCSSRPQSFRRFSAIIRSRVSIAGRSSGVCASPVKSSVLAQ